MKQPHNIQILQATDIKQLDQVRNLIRAFVDWHRQRHVEDIELIDRYFDPNAFEEELVSLPGKYSPPKGRLLLAMHDGKPSGCVALREIDSEACEMKRMFVYEKFHGKGIGRSLGAAVIHEARVAGYRSMKLDTSFRQVEAQALYQSLGFVKTAPYYKLSKDLEDWLVFMELKL